MVSARRLRTGQLPRGLTGIVGENGNTLELIIQSGVVDAPVGTEAQFVTWDGRDTGGRKAAAGIYFVRPGSLDVGQGRAPRGWRPQALPVRTLRAGSP